MRTLIATLALLLISPQIAVAQLQRIKAEPALLVESDVSPGRRFAPRSTCDFQNASTSSPMPARSDVDSDSAHRRRP